MLLKLSRADLIRENARLHDLVAGDYDRLHTEIYNPTEQRRLERELDRAVALVRTPHTRALDFGCGTGNLTGKLLARGLDVWAADVSAEMLDVLRRRHAAHAASLHTVPLSGEFPLPFPDRSFAFVAAYSVLHHVPDYLEAVRELARVVDDGGVLYIDHELSADHWRSPLGVRIHRGLTMPGYSFRRALAWAGAWFGRKEAPLPPPGARDLTEEGDIHIHADDHIEWDRIRAIVAARGFTPLAAPDYLLCRETSRFPIRHWICRRFATDTSFYVGYKSSS